MKLKFIVFVIFIFSASIVCAKTTEIYPFKTAGQQQQFSDLISQFRCLVCQNQNLADSNAPLAKDLRTEVYKLVQQNQSSLEIKTYLIKRYGDFVLFKPPLNHQTLLLWFMPFILLLIGVLIILRRVYRRS